MPKKSLQSGKVLIVDGNDSISSMIAMLLQRAGFTTRIVHDAEAAAAELATSRYDVIVRDLNLTPAMREQSLRALAATAPEFLRRTVIATTARDCAEQNLVASMVFTIIGKPFNVDELVRAVRQCASRERRDEPGGGAMSLDSLQKFLMSAPTLRRLLESPAHTKRELYLRAEMRRNALALSAMLQEAARVEPNRIRAATFHSASTLAAEIAATAPPVMPRHARRDH